MVTSPGTHGTTRSRRIHAQARSITYNPIMNTPPRNALVRIVLMASALLMLPAIGCTTSYTAQVRNETSLTLEARLLHDQFAADSIELDAASIPPGGVITLGPSSVPLTDTVKLSVEIVRDRGNVPTRKTISRGMSRFVVETDGDPAYSLIRVRLLDHSTPFRFSASSDGALDE